MIIDCHTHIFPDEIKKSRHEFFHGEDEFSLLYKDPKSRISSAEELIISMDENGIDKSIVFGFPWNSGEFAKSNNDYIIEKSIQYSQRLIPFACFNPVKAYCLKEAERALKNGFTGFGELGLYSSDFTGETLLSLTPLMDMAVENNIPVIFHVNEPCGHIYPGKAPISIRGIDLFIERFRKNRIILAHLGGGFPFFSLLKKPPNIENILFDTAALPFLYKKNIYEIMESMGLNDKIVFGSDWPLISPERYISEINGNDISEKFKDRILSENIMNFL